MAQEQIADILMMIVGKDKKPIRGDGLTELGNNKDLLDGFTAGHFFELSDFDFGINAVDNDSSSFGGGGDLAPMAKMLQHGMGQFMDHMQKSLPKPDGTKPMGGPFFKSSTGKFSKFVQSGMTTDGQKRLYPIQMDEFSFTKQIDSASPQLFHHCFKCITFQSAAVVMRRDAGYDPDDAVAKMAFLRIDFTNGVLITDISWKVADIGVTETIKLVARQVRVRYAAQGHDGKPRDRTPLDTDGMAGAPLTLAADTSSQSSSS